MMHFESYALSFFLNIKTESVSYITMYNNINILIYLKISNAL